MNSPSLSRSISGLTALVTGAGSGMGRATAMLLASEGARVAVTDIDAGSADAVTELIDRAGGVARAWTLDVAAPGDVESVAVEVAAEYGGIDLVINNAGIATFSPIDAEDYPLIWHRSLEVLLTAHTSVIRSCLPFLRQSPSPRIVNIASTEGWGATKYASAYTAAKHGVVGLTKAMAVELGAEAITVNCVCPGPIETAMTSSIPEDQKQIFARRRTALGRYGQPEEVAHATLNFCLPASSYMTGVILPVDGGLLVKNA